MNKEQLTDKLNFLENRLKKLVKEHNVLKLENNSLKQENLQLRLKHEGLQDHLKNFQNQEKIGKIAITLADHTHNRTELKLKINEFIKEIDKCIAHLSE
jgi:regulator of replication initiation timing